MFSSSRAVSLLRWTVFCLVFWGIPVFLISFFFGQISREKESSRRAVLEDRLEKTLSEFSPWFDTKFFMNKLLLEFVQKNISKSSDLRAVKRKIEALKRRFPGVFEFIFLDGRGKPIPDLCEGNPPKTVLSKFFHAWKDRCSGNISSLKRDWPIFINLIGPLAKIEAMNPNQVRKISYGMKRTFIFISAPQDNGMMIAHMNQVPKWDSMALCDRVENFNRKSWKEKALVVDLEQSFANDGHFRDLGTTEQKQVTALLEKSPSRFLSKSGYLWEQVIVSPQIRLIVSGKERQDPEMLRNRNSLVALLTGIFGILSFFSLRVMNGWTPLFLSIRVKLLFLFLYTVGLPLAVLAVNSRNLISERRKVMEGRVFQETEKLLVGFDKKMPQLIGILERFLRKRIAQPLPSQLSFSEGSVRRMIYLNKQVNPSSGWLVDENGNPAMEDRLRMTVDAKKYAKHGSKFYANFLRGINQSEAGARELADDKLSQAAAISGVDIEQIFLGLEGAINEIKEIKIGDVANFFGMFPIYDFSGVARFLGVFTWGRGRLEKIYIKRNLIPMEAQLENTQLAAFYPELDRFYFPRSFRFPKMTKPYMKKLALQSQPIKERVQVGEITYLITAIKGLELGHFNIVAVTADHRIRGELAKIRERLNWITIAILFISGTIGAVLARQILRPIKNLSKGIEAIKSRNFHLDIPVTADDELGALSKTFNDMMAGLADLEVARIVQESLFPQKLLRTPRITVFGSCIPATEVGGDYYDYFQTPDNQVVIIIGDVSGHGVSAAMVMAMAKAVVAIPENGFDPAATLSIMDHVFSKTLHRKKMMTCFFALIDPERRTIRFSNAGQTDPYLIRRGKIRPLVSRHMLLGTGFKKGYANSGEALESGDRIVFFTDGIIEAIGLNGKSIGFAKFEEALITLENSDVPKMEYEIRAWFNQTVRPGPQEDDITLVLAKIE